MSYQPSEVLITVHVSPAPIPTTLLADPSEIGTVDAPVDEGTTHNITATLTDAGGNPIEGKTLHFYDPDGAELGTGVTDVNGQTVFTYTADVTHDGKQLKIAYLGD